ncbi:hypothetical protein MTO96_003280 [Rhipicephalus appendiculatus]
MEKTEYIDVPEWVIIHELYEGENSHEAFELDFDRALEAGPASIIVEPRRLGEETARWIALGNCLHQTSLLSGIGSLATTLLLCPPSPTPSSAHTLFVIGAPLAGVSAFCAYRLLAIVGNRPLHPLPGRERSGRPRSATTEGTG